MSKKIRHVAVLGVVALAALALASLPALAQDEVTGNTPKLAVRGHGSGVYLLDRNNDGDHAVPNPGVPPDKDPKPGRLAGAPNHTVNAADTTGGFGASVVGGGSTMSSKSDRVERSLRSVADRLR